MEAEHSHKMKILNTVEIQSVIGEWKDLAKTWNEEMEGN